MHLVQALGSDMDWIHENINNITTITITITSSPTPYPYA